MGFMAGMGTQVTSSVKPASSRVSCISFSQKALKGAAARVPMTAPMTSGQNKRIETWGRVMMARPVLSQAERRCAVVRQRR